MKRNFLFLGLGLLISSIICYFLFPMTQNFTLLYVTIKKEVPIGNTWIDEIIPITVFIFNYFNIGLVMTLFGLATFFSWLGMRTPN